MSPQTIHLVSAADGNWRDIAASIHDGDVAEVAGAVMDRIASHGHQVRETGSSWTRHDGQPRTLHYEVTVQMRGEPWVWRHTFTQPGERYPS